MEISKAISPYLTHCATFPVHDHLNIEDRSVSKTNKNKQKANKKTSDAYIIVKTDYTRNSSKQNIRLEGKCKENKEGKRRELAGQGMVNKKKMQFGMR